MAEMTITLRRGDTGATLVIVGLCSGRDVLPHESEADHRRLVSALLPSAVVMERERPSREPVVG